MKTKLVGMAAVGLVVALCAPAWAISVATVGSTDPLVASAQLGNSGEATEEAWVESVLGVDVTFSYRLNSGGSWSEVDGVANTFALELNGTPGYFLLKTGNLNSVTDPDNPNTHFLFQNLSQLAWAVVNFTSMGYTPVVTQVTKISHITEFAPVPEPGTLLLLGTGLLGLGLLRRRKSAR